MSNRRGFLGLLAGGALAGPEAAKKVLEDAAVGRAAANLARAVAAEDKLRELEAKR